MSTEIDLFSLRPNDSHAMADLIDLLVAHCDVEQVAHFLEDFAHWHRLQGRKIRHRDRADARRELEEWQRFINSLPDETP